MGTLKHWVVGAAVAVSMCVPALAAETKADAYPLTTCPVSGKELGSEAVSKEYDGREVKFCCGGCPANFEKAKEENLAKLDKAIIEQQDKDYPLTNCVNTGKALGENPVSFVIGNKLMKTCCENCKAKLEGDKTAALEKHAAAIIEKETPSYPAKKCPVSGEELGAMGDPVNVVIGAKLVKLCCAGCEKKVAAEPAKYVAMVWSAPAEAKEGAAADTAEKPSRKDR